MFVRKKNNKSGVVSIQVLEKRDGRSILIKTIGSSADAGKIEELLKQGRAYIASFAGQQLLQFDNEKQLVDAYFNSLHSLRLVGPELILGKIFDEIGFNQISDQLFRHLVITRLVYPVSKLKTTDYLYKYNQEQIDVERIYRYLDKLYNKQKQLLQQISYEHTQKVLGGQVNIVFYDVTTLHFESEHPDELRKTGFSKEGRHQDPQIVLGLLVSSGGYPLAYEIFEGNKFEGYTMLPVIEAFKIRFGLADLVVVADAGLLSSDNIRQLQQNGYQYILGARVKNESRLLQQQIQEQKPANGQSICLQKDSDTRLIVSYAASRAARDADNRKRGLEKLQKQIVSGKLTKAHVNNRGYNKYLQMDGQIDICINWEKYQQDAAWDGLKGYLTNTTLTKEAVIDNYNQLWQIEKAFRISKSDLRIGPIYHRIQRRIEAHICIAFCAYKVYKELDRQLKSLNAAWTPEQVIDICKTIYAVSFKTTLSSNLHTRLHIDNPEKEKLIKMFKIQIG
ncbi:IS1634 family transposase [Dyadobacter jiangsuensis]